MRDARYFLDQAERCFRLARASNDRERTGRLESMAAEFIGKAVELRATLEPAATPVTVKAKPSSRGAFGGGGSQSSGPAGALRRKVSGSHAD